MKHKKNVLLKKLQYFKSQFTISLIVKRLLHFETSITIYDYCSFFLFLDKLLLFLTINILLISLWISYNISDAIAIDGTQWEWVLWMLCIGFELFVIVIFHCFKYILNKLYFNIESLYDIKTEYDNIKNTEVEVLTPEVVTIPQAEKESLSLQEIQQKVSKGTPLTLEENKFYKTKLKTDIVPVNQN